MNWLELAAESTFRSLALAAVVALALARVRRPQTRLMAWTSVLYASLLMPGLPAMTRWLVPAEPLRLSLPVTWSTLGAAAVPVTAVNWAGLLDWAYLAVAAILLARTLTGVVLTARLARRARPLPELGREVRESDAIEVPVTFGKTILLPTAWWNWADATLETVLAHERSHIDRADTLTLLLARIHRDLFWFNPLSWRLVAHLADLAEQASDDAALLATGDRPRYAEILVAFASRAGRLPAAGLGMARTSNVVRRVDRILDAAFQPARALSWQSRAALLAATLPLIVGVAAVHAQAQSRTEKMRWVLIDGSRTSMDGGNRDEERARSLGGRFQEPYLWVRTGEGEFVIDDRATIAEIQALWKPMEELGRQQAELGKEQAKLGEQQAKLGEQQARASAPAPNLERELRDLEARLRALRGKNATQAELGDIQASIGAIQAELGKAQGAVGDVQARLGEQQAKLGGQQAVLGGKQAILGGKQAEASGKAIREMERIVPAAIRDGRAKKI